MKTLAILLGAALFMAPVALAADPLAGGVEVTPRRVVEPELQPKDPDPGAAVKPGFFDDVHGEVGAMIGTNGARGAWGTVHKPIGDDGYVSFTFENFRYGDRD